MKPFMYSRRGQLQFERRHRSAVQDVFADGQRQRGRGVGGDVGWRRRRRRRRSVRLQEKAPPQPYHFHHVPASRVGARLREEPLPGRVQSRGARHEGQSAGSARPSEF